MKQLLVYFFCWYGVYLFDAWIETQRLVPLRIEYPRYAYTTCYSSCRLNSFGLVSEPRAGLPPPVIMVPQGCTNLALGRPVTALDPDPIIGELKMITDGNKELPYSSEHYVEFGNGPQWVQIDLGRVCDIRAIAMWHNFRNATYVFGVVVQISNDPTFAKDVVTVYNNDQENKCGQGAGTAPVYIESEKGKLLEVKNTTGQYVRLYSAGCSIDDNNAYAEVEVWGL